MEEEARPNLTKALDKEPEPAKGPGTALHVFFKPFAGKALEPPPREPMRKPPRFA